MLDAKPLSPRITDEEAQRVAEAFLEYKNVLRSVSTRGRVDPVSKYFLNLEQRPPIKIENGVAYYILLGDTNKVITLPEIKTDRPSSFIIIRTYLEFGSKARAPFAEPFTALVSTDELTSMTLDELWDCSHTTSRP